ncbi:MAG: 23S rRNA (uracil(1939)-C(5))-methyltransferase RlmD [Pseudomonadota bacterium]
MRRRRRQLPTESKTATVHALSHEGRGIAHLEGKTIFIHNALPGETVEFTYTHCTRSYDEAIATRIVEPSSHRTTPACAYYTVCGGCQLQHMDMALQLSHKQKVLLEQLTHFGNVTPKAILPALSGKPLQYRNKARLGVRYVDKKGQRVLVGFRERNGRYLADMNACEVLHPAVGKSIPALSALVHSLSCYEHLPQIEVAIGDDKVALIFRHMVPLTHDDLNHLEVFSQTHNIEIYSHPNSPEKIKKLFPNDGYERLRYLLPKHNLEMRFHPSDFTQVNEEMNQLMMDRALELLNPQSHETILDLFCGIGNFTLAIARYAKHVVGVEGAEAAVDRAKENAIHNNIHNTEFFVADLSKDCSTMPWMNREYDKILLDPSRAGADGILAALPRLNAHTIVYVSCNPATLARDAGILVNQLGYTLESAGIMNMFPHTSHMESIALFTKS